MGMFDKPQYLTGKDGFVEAGDTFWLHNAKLDGQSTTQNGEKRDQAKLLVSKARGDTPVPVYTSGIGIVNMVRRIDTDDRAAMPLEVRLDQVPSGKGNPTFVLTPADAPAPTTASDDDIPF